MNSEFARVLATEMKHYSESKDLETISRVHGELDELKNIMIKNIGKFIYLTVHWNYTLRILKTWKFSLQIAYYQI